ncbi:hypothetical protein [Gorillibacterium sp. sgz5001074]|uniref:hypothetical protein n=1 Tax=Gorillibacterium sp. sgz5001074 TaxID=3446695 RepID=UPI003F66CD82
MGNVKQIKGASGPTIVEFTMIRDYIVLLHMQTIVERCIEGIRFEYANNILCPMLSEVVHYLMSDITNDLYTLKGELKARKIKFLNDEQGESVLYYSYLCRGYQERFGFWREAARSQISIRLGQYISSLTNRFK